MVPLTLALDPRSNTPLHRQLYEEIRAAVLAGRISGGARLPSTRALAADLDISRNTVAGAFDQLLAEGYIEGRPGAGTFVAKELPEELLRVSPASPAPTHARSPAPELSERGRMLAAIPVAPATRGGASACAFRPGIPALDAFPRDLWARIAARLYRHAKFDLFSYGDASGYAPLRRAIAEYLRAARGVHCTCEQVIVTSGSQQALDLAARVLLDPGDTAWVEDPGYFGARGALMAAGIRCAPIPVDAEGLSRRAGRVVGPAGSHGVRLAIAPVSAGRNHVAAAPHGAAGLGPAS